MLKMTFFAQPGPYPGTYIPVSGVPAQPFWAGCDSAQSPFPLCLGYKGLSVSWLTHCGSCHLLCRDVFAGDGVQEGGFDPLLKIYDLCR